MLKKITIRGGLAATISGYTLLLMLVVAAAIAGLYGSNAALREMYRDDTASLLHLKTSSERLLLLRGGLGEVEQLVSAGKPAGKEIARLHALLNESNGELDAYRSLHDMDETEKPLFDALQAKRGELLKQVFQLALKQLDEENLVDFLSTQREASAPLFADYQSALTALENYQVQRQKGRFDSADARFHLMLWALVAAGVLALGIGVLAQRALAGAIVQPVRLAVEYFGRIAAGDLTSTVDVQRDNEMGYLLDALRGMQHSLVQTVQKVRGSTEAIVHDARAIASGSAALSTRTEQQAESLQQAAASVEQLTATVRQNADNARSASELAIGASGIASRGGLVVGEVIATMDAISTSSGEIVGIVGVIEGIAFQTNILALNAAVEAARAGEQGRGFAVVAAEVRNLAQRSASAAKEIKELIGDSTRKVRDGSALVARAGATMDEVVQAVGRVTAIMSEISLASSEQTVGIELVNNTVIQMEEMTQQNSALVQEASAAAASLEQQSRQLDEAVAVFRLKQT
ncbi:methyl-accepting chemotaxis protein [Paraburkholderia sp. D15]|uniref:methyl-accepting chemotaxis protein n=1 Tax=Paraburkholderia sp. D15 TaxID=2880218 RepID=UPI0024784A50|nr:methyl-accepting chemotaxis protein [Paraburkholderia sp. D15]WGS54768.1 methyl-accepting chemotaxis protein [Paraburkholderia sp. D15]